jgi:hypothetical protein
VRIYGTRKSKTHAHDSFRQRQHRLSRTLLLVRKSQDALDFARDVAAFTARHTAHDALAGGAARLRGVCQWRPILLAIART